ncbi:MAG: DUF2577 domain-containing protein [Lachnospiraceae bacterium]|nr:DUF2577 domain-containing protein [Lachnospiraceae bacterium]
MPDMGWIQLMKRAAMEAVSASKPCSYCIGIVTGESPLEIKVSQTVSVDADFLDIPERMTDYNTRIEIDGITHKCVVKNRLKTGDRVLLLRKAGGQRFAVIDRVVV